MPCSLRLRLITASLLCAGIHAQVVDTDKGRLEFLGLESCSPQKLIATFQEKYRGHFCAATLKEDLGFAEAAVLLFGNPPVTVVAVVEREHAARVRYKAAPEGTGFVPAGWEAGAALVEKEGMAFQAAVVQFPLVLAKDADAGAAALAGSWEAEDIQRARAIWIMLRERSTPADCTRALWCLDHDAHVPVRQLAAAVLMNFHRDDAAWWALADGLRDSDDRVKMTCQQALAALAKHVARPVDWKPAVPAVRAVLDGTNLTAFGALARALVATGVAPELAPDLLAGAGHALLVHANADRESLREGAVAVLERLRGKKLSGDESWAQWVGKLEPRAVIGR
jgi:hypothetical protein